jgi:hypothetical protein
MQISDRFVDYGVVGAFFLIVQYTLLALWGQAGWIINHLTALAQPIPTQLTIPIATLLTILGIIGIFFFGLFFDLFTIFSFPLEIFVFDKFFRQNQEWLEEMHKQNKYSYLKKDIKNFLDTSNDLKSKCTSNDLKSKLCFIFLFLRPSHLNHLQPSYYRLRYFLNSFILLYSGVTQFDELTDQKHMWRTSRAIFSASVILFIEPLFVTLIWLYNFIDKDISSMKPNLITFIITWGVLFVLMLMTMIMANGAYSRMCSTMFSLAHIAYKKNPDNLNGNNEGRNNVGVESGG